MNDSIIVRYVGEPPHHQHHRDAGGDLVAAEDMYVEAGEYETVSTRTAVAIPYGYFARIESRSGLAFKHGIEAFNGIIDSGYRGVINVKLTNNSNKGFIVKAGDRIAQLVMYHAIPTAYVPVDSLDDTARGSRGFGSTGTSQARSELTSKGSHYYDQNGKEMKLGGDGNPPKLTAGIVHGTR